jgi:hypothetical protein
MKNTKWSFFSAFRFVVPAEYEAWFERMEQNGWHLNKIGQWSSIAMKFERGEPKKYRYVFDVKTRLTRDYVSTYEQFGWVLVGRMASACIWRMAYEHDRPEAFSDRESLQKRNTRTYYAVMVSFVLFLLLPLVLAIPIFFPSVPLSQGDVVQLSIAMGLSLLTAVLLGRVMVKIKKNNA